ncbi:MAG: HAD family hydrolase [Anaerolineae bacterium]
MKLLIWDFDGTLGYREGGAWTASVLETLQQAEPAREVTFEQLRPYMDTGFRWHRPDVRHIPVASVIGPDADAWWAELEPVFARAYESVGLSEDAAATLAKRVRDTYLNLSRWRSFDDAEPALGRLAAGGWTHVMLTNHVPELPLIVRELGLEGHFARIFNSAVMGYEKPNPEAFRIVLDAYPEAEACWMIGDSYRADVQGAEAAGIPAVLVRRPHPDAEFYAESLRAVFSSISPLRDAARRGFHP